MKSALSTVLFHLVCMFVWISLEGLSLSQDHLTVRDRELISWFEKLGYPDFRGKPPVTVLTGWWSRSGDLPPSNSTLIGILLSSDESKFEVFGFDLTIYEFEFTPAGTAPHEMVTFKKTDYETLVENEIQKRNASREDRPWSHYFGQKTTEPVKLLALASAAAVNGFEDEARQILQLARSIPDRLNENLDLEKRIQRDIAHTSTWTAFLAFGNPEISREQLLQKFEHLDQYFPQSKHNQRVQATITLLKKMVKEDEAHSKSAKPMAELSGEELIAELIFQLRDQNGHQWSQPGACDIFLDSRGESSPAHRLLQLKEQAVPQLIEAMDDRQFTRSVGYHRDFYFSHHVLRVGDCAQTILSRIAGRRFYARRSTNGAMIKDDQAVTAKMLAEKWWNDVQSKGVKAVLIEAVRSGDPDSVYQARRLVDEFPNDAIDAIAVGIKNGDHWVVESLISIVASIDDEKVNSLLKQQIMHAENIRTRVVAAKALAKSDHEFALSAMRKLWLSSTESTKTFPRYDNRVTLAEFLLTSNSKTAIEVVDQQFHLLPTRERFEIIESLEISDDFKSKNMPVIEKFLAGQLQDNNSTNRAGTYHGQSLNNPRIRDIAGFKMTAIWPKKYNCRVDGTRRQRDRSQQQALNRWRTENHLEPFVFPAPFTARPVSAKETDKLSFDILNAKTNGDAAAAIAKYKELGTGAIDAVSSLKETIGAYHPLKANVDQLFLEIANTVTRASITSKITEQNSQTWRERIHEIEGGPLTPDWLIRQLTEFAKERPTPGIRLFASRESPENGIELNIDFIVRGQPRSGTQPMWNFSQNISVDGRTILDSHSASSLNYAQHEDGYTDLKRELQKIYRNATEPFEIDISLVIDK